MSRAFIETVNTSTQNVAENGTVSAGNTVRRFGCNLRLQGDGVEMRGNGYYEFIASVVCAPNEEGEITATLYKDDQPIIGAFATQTVFSAGDVVTLTIPTAIRECGCECTSNITCVLSQAASVTKYVLIGERK